jgi:hypothetical protein
MARSGGTVECAPDDRSNGEPGRPRQARIAFALLAAVWKEIDHQVPSLSRVRVRSGSVFIPPIWTLIQYSPVTVKHFSHNISLQHTIISTLGAGQLLILTRLIRMDLSRWILEMARGVLSLEIMKVK